VSIKDHIMLGLDEQVLIMYWRMRDLWGPINLVVSLTTWLKHNHYSKVVVGGRMR
jgi:hypothetical protein